MKYTFLLFLLGILFPLFTSQAQSSFLEGIIANGGGEANGSHHIVGTFGQPITGNSGTQLQSGFWFSSTLLTDIEETYNEGIPTDYKLYNNYPNPFNPSTTIKFVIPSTSYVSIQIYNTLGQAIATLFDGVQNAGYHSLVWKTNNSPSGVYFYVVRARSIEANKEFNQVRKMILLR